jgi:hypothetical protein
MNAIIVRPPPTVRAPTLKKYAPMSARLGVVEAATPIAGPAPDIGQTSGKTTNAKARTPTTTTPSFAEWKSSRPTPPASRRMAPTPSGVKIEVSAAAARMIACGIALTADRPSRYTATRKMPSTTGPSP